MRHATLVGNSKSQAPNPFDKLTLAGEASHASLWTSASPLHQRLACFGTEGIYGFVGLFLRK